MGWGRELFTSHHSPLDPSGSADSPLACPCMSKRLFRNHLSHAYIFLQRMSTSSHMRLSIHSDNCAFNKETRTRTSAGNKQ